MNLLNTSEIVEQYLSQAEDLFGPMVPYWTFRGVEFRDRGPHLAYYPESGEVAISLSERARNNEVQLRFQLAHEVCHLLYPSMDLKTQELDDINVLNEGISTFYSVLVFANTDLVGGIIDDLQTNSAHYFDAFVHVKDLLAVDIHAVRKLREIEPLINRVEHSHFDEAGVSITDEQVAWLLGTFKEQ